MVTERADAPEPGGEPDVQEQGGMFDITPDTSAVDDAPRSTDEGTQLSMEETPSLTPEVPESPAEQPAPEQASGVSPTSFSELQEQVKQQQEQLQYFNQREQQTQLQQQATQWEQELQRQGYLPEQARQIAVERMTKTQEVTQAQQQARQFQEFQVGRHNAALHFAKEHKLGFDDLTQLEKYNTPEEMEIEAKRIAETRDLKAELARMKQDQVPAQSFDNNQPSPAATGSEDDLLDKYIAGDRSPSVVAAAARLLG